MPETDLSPLRRRSVDRGAPRFAGGADPRSAPERQDHARAARRHARGIRVPELRRRSDPQRRDDGSGRLRRRRERAHQLDARAIGFAEDSSVEPALILADEPTGNRNRANGEQLTIAKNRGIKKA